MRCVGQGRRDGAQRGRGEFREGHRNRVEQSTRPCGACFSQKACSGGLRILTSAPGTCLTPRAALSLSAFPRPPSAQAIRKRQEEEAKRRMEELAAAQVDVDAKFASLDEEINVGRCIRGGLQRRESLPWALSS
jgi:hypothetical protein